MSKLNDWYESLPEHTKVWLKNQPIYKEKDIHKALIVGAVIGFFIGVIVGYEWAYTPVINTFRPLIG